jgi:hypothetical protein
MFAGMHEHNTTSHKFIPHIRTCHTCTTAPQSDPEINLGEVAVIELADETRWQSSNCLLVLWRVFDGWAATMEQVHVKGGGAHSTTSPLKARPRTRTQTADAHTHMQPSPTLSPAWTVDPRTAAENVSKP